MQPTAGSAPRLAPCSVARRRWASTPPAAAARRGRQATATGAPAGRGLLLLALLVLAATCAAVAAATKLHHVACHKPACSTMLTPGAPPPGRSLRRLPLCSLRRERGGGCGQPRSAQGQRAVPPDAYCRCRCCCLQRCAYPPPVTHILTPTVAAPTLAAAEWVCPCCRDLCNCSRHRKLRKWEATGMLHHRVKARGERWGTQAPGCNTTRLTDARH